jgi:putative ABC transport system permease protein
MDVGFNKDQIVVIHLHDENLKTFDAIKAEMKTNPNILEVSVSDALPSNIQSQSGPTWPGMPEDINYFDIYVAAVDEDYVETFDLELVAGRNFSQEYPTDTKGAFIFNQALVDALGWEAPLGREFVYWRGEVGRIVGVVKDFNFHSLHKNIEPMYFFYHENPWNRSYLSVKIQRGTIPESIDYLSGILKKFSPSYPMDFSFFDDIFDRAYRSEQRLGTMFNIFGLLAIGIACLGLFGLAAFSTEQRTKEIGIRKILGASLPEIFVLMSKDFLKGVLLSNLLAWPTAYLTMHYWLQNFAYQAPLSIWLFFFTAAAAFSIAFVTIIFHTFKAAIANPVDSLRYE